MDNAVTISLKTISSHIVIGTLAANASNSSIYILDKGGRSNGRVAMATFFIDNPDSVDHLPGKKNVAGGDSFRQRLLIDTLLREREKVRLHFTSGDRVFQTIEVERLSISPVIAFYREAGRHDTTKQSLRSAIVNEQQYLEEFLPATVIPFQVHAGKRMEIVFKNLLLNVDSCLSYRLSRTSDSGSWQPTGNFTLIPFLTPNTTYTLAVRYRGNSQATIYTIEVLPAWYQQPGGMIAIIGLALLVLLVAGLVHARARWKSEQVTNREIRYKLRAIQAQLNPHFIFNALTSIQSLVNTDQKKQANEYLTRFSTVLRGALSNSESLAISLEEELSLLSNYLEIEQLRFRFQYSISVEAGVATKELTIPPMLLQPTIENAIVHGISAQGDGGIINIEISRIDGEFSVRIADNGSWNNPRGPNGYGISLTEERIAAIGQLNDRRKINYEVRPSETGTVIIFNFINWEI